MKQEIGQMSIHLHQTQDKIQSILNRYETLVRSLSDVMVYPDTQFYFIGNGSSGEGARIASYVALDLFKKNPMCINPNQFVHYSHRALKAHDVVIALSQTGTSHLVVESVRLANQTNATTIALSATKGCPLLAEAQFPILLEECVEKVDYKVTGVLGMLYGLWISLYGIALANDYVTAQAVDEVVAGFHAMNNRYDELVDQAKQWTNKRVEVLEQAKTLSVLGSGPLSEIAMEMAVKSAEVQNRFTISVDTEEFLHGYCAADAKENLVVLFVDESSYDFSKKVADALEGLNRSFLWIGHQALEGHCDVEIQVEQKFNAAIFMPVVHSMLVEWARMYDYGDVGTKIFAYYQDKIKVREE